MRYTHGVLRVILAALCVGRLAAQIAPLDVTTVKSDSTGYSLVRVRNDYFVPATAIVIAREVQRPRWWASGGTYMPPSVYIIGGEFRRLVVRDTVLDVALPPGGLLDICPIWPPDSRNGGPWYLVAAIFANGTTAGEDAEVAKIVLPRWRAYEDIRRALVILAGSSNLAHDFSAWQRTSTAPETFSTSEMDVPGRVLSLLKQGKVQPEIVDLLHVWQDRLAGSKPSIFAGR